MRPSKVVYDRKYSAMSAVKPGDFDWDKILADATWLHWTGITPSISDGAAAAIDRNPQMAKEALKVLAETGRTALIG